MKFHVRTFKGQRALVALATQQSGAQRSCFLNMLDQRTSQGLLAHPRQLRAQNVVQWATNHSGLQE
eukprot:10455703-Lingulodinium_polyedra.AAC.1